MIRTLWTSFGDWVLSQENTPLNEDVRTTPLSKDKPARRLPGCSARIELVSSTFTGSRARPLHYEHHPQLQRKERESNSQGLSARPASNRLPSPVGLPFRCAAA